MSGVREVAVGSYHACALKLDHTVQCWGHNYRGQLGIGSTEERDPPVLVPGLTDVAMIAVGGGNYTCALSSSGDVACWGQRNEPNDPPKPSPVRVEGLPPMRAIAVYDDQACGVSTNGAVHCWGPSDSPDPGHVRPIKVEGWADVRTVAVGDRHRCALDRGGAVSCMGWGDDGELGVANDRADKPARVEAFDPLAARLRARSVFTGSNLTCVIDDARKLWCFGTNDVGQLGVGETGTFYDPIEVNGTDGAEQVLTFHDGGCALRPDGTVVCWGAGGGRARPLAGSNEAAGWPSAEPVVKLPKATRLFHGADFGQACLTDERRDFWCFRHGWFIQANGRPSDFEGYRVVGLRDVVDLAPYGTFRGLAVTGAGRVIAVREESTSRRRRPPTLDVSTREVMGVGVVKQIAASADKACALRRDGTVACWATGRSFDEEGASGPLAPRVVTVLGLQDVVSLGEYFGRFCGHRRDGMVSCWRMKKTADSVSVGPLEDVTKATLLGRAGGCAVTDRGLACGASRSGVSGDGFNAIRYSGPVLAVDGGADAMNNTCFITKERKVMCWGDNDRGAVGSRDRYRSVEPLEVSGLDL